MTNDRFYELALKACARECTPSEQAELDALLVTHPELKAELDELQADARLAREVLPLVEAVQSASEAIPSYARGRLQMKVRETLGRPATRGPGRPGLTWRWFLGLAATAAIVALVIAPLLLAPPKMQIQVAVLDLAGPTRGAGTNEFGMFMEKWGQAAVTNISSTSDLKSWEGAWSANGRGYAVKVIYDRAAAQIRVVGKGHGREFTSQFSVGPDARQTLDQVQDYIKQETAK